MTPYKLSQTSFDTSTIEPTPKQLLPGISERGEGVNNSSFSGDIEALCGSGGGIDCALS
jgi:hypothetical protein